MDRSLKTTTEILLNIGRINDNEILLVGPLFEKFFIKTVKQPFLRKILTC